jgi:hypothetical protein
MKVGAINFSELGSECWDPARMGSECKIARSCRWASKKHCKAYVITRNYKVQIVRVSCDGSKQILKEYETTKPLQKTGETL